MIKARKRNRVDRVACDRGIRDHFWKFVEMVEIDRLAEVIAENI